MTHEPASIAVAVVDSGWDRSIPEPRVDAGIGLVGGGDDGLTLDPSTDDHDRHGHGTVCSNLILSGAPEVHIVPVRVFGRRIETSPRVLVAAVDWIADRRIPVANLSLSTLRIDALRPLYRACHRAAERGVILVAAAAPERGLWSFPSHFDCVIGVGSMSHPDPGHIEFRESSVPECFAVGRQRAVGLQGQPVDVDSVSFAAPMVTARIARLLATTPGLDVDGVRRQLAAETHVTPNLRKRR